MEQTHKAKLVAQQGARIKKRVLWKLGAPIYKFSKRNGRNCGALQKDEKRDHQLYEYSDEM